MNEYSKDKQNMSYKGIMKSNRIDMRRTLAIDAALLMYVEKIKDYKLAKLTAAKKYHTKYLPTNDEISEQVDFFIKMNENYDSKLDKLQQMRNDAFDLMLILYEFTPKLIGSVFYGDITLGSDIDISVFYDDVNDILDVLYSEDIIYSHSANEDYTFLGINLKSGESIELILCSSELTDVSPKLITGWDIYGLAQTIDRLDSLCALEESLQSCYEDGDFIES